MSEWISVEDYIPPEGKMVILWAYGDYDLGTQIGGDILTLFDGIWCAEPGAEYWMPLPEPPKEQP